jgi:hypothetical protein
MVSSFGVDRSFGIALGGHGTGMTGQEVILSRIPFPQFGRQLAIAYEAQLLIPAVLYNPCDDAESITIIFSCYPVDVSMPYILHLGIAGPCACHIQFLAFPANAIGAPQAASV